MLWSVFVAMGGATDVDALSDPRPSGRWVVDAAGVIPADDEAELDAELGELYRDLTVEMVVVTVPSAAAPTPKHFATTLFNTWELGGAEANNGVLVLLVMDRRRLEMEVGIGLEPVLPDGWLGAMQSRVMVPRFRQDDVGTGLADGVEAVVARLRSRPEDARQGSRGQVAGQRARDAEDPGATWVVPVALGGLGAASVVGFGVVLWRRRKPRAYLRCPEHDVYMPLVPPHEEDEHLTEGQIREELLGAVDHQIHMCPVCGHTEHFRVQRWRSDVKQCPQCEHETVQTTEETIRKPTRKRTGVVEVTERCAHCGYTDVTRKKTPRLPPPGPRGGPPIIFTGGGFGGGGFGGGGGFSGGGGAGSSW